MKKTIKTHELLGLVSKYDVARAAGVNSGSISRWIKMGIIPKPNVKHGIKYYWKKEALTNLLSIIG